MEVYEAVRTMLAVRDYTSQPVPDAIVTRILEAARLTGSSRNKQHWDFIVIRERDTLQRLGEAARTGPYISKAPLAVAVLVPEAPVGYIDGARAIQDMMLTAWEAGVGSNWVSNLNIPDVRELLNIPEERMLLAVIPFGYPAEKRSGKHKQRKSLAEIAHAERYGNSWESDT